MQNVAKKVQKRTIQISTLFLMIVATFFALFFSHGVGNVAHASTSNWVVENGTVISYQGAEKEITIPSEYLGEPLTAIGEGAFNKNANVEKVIIPDSVKTIGKRAFEELTSLKSVEIGSGVTLIDDYAFLNCSNLEGITIPSSVKTIGTWAFGYCAKLEHLNLSEGLERIYPASFYGCKALNSVVLPDTVTYIDTHVFRGCESLQNITLSSNLKTIPFRAFSGCISLKSITLPSSIVTVAGEAFYESGIEKATVLGELETIGDKAFYGCRYLREINVPNSLTYLGESAFMGCSNLLKVNIGEGITRIESNTFNGCGKLLSVTLSKNLAVIGDGAFDGCIRLVEIINLSGLDIKKASEEHGKIALNAKVIHNSTIEPFVVIDKGGFAFFDDGSERAIFLAYGGGAKVVELPKDANGKPFDIEKNAFLGDKDITSITIPTCVQRIGDNAFYGLSSSVKVIYAGNWSQWQSVNVEQGNSCLNTILFLGSDKTENEQNGANDGADGGVSFLDKMGNVWKEIISIIVENIFLVNFLLVLFWGVILIYNKKSQKNKLIFVIIVCVQWILISGLRADSVGADTENYMNIFDEHSSLSWRGVFIEIKRYFASFFSSSVESSDFEPLFILYNKLVSVLTKNHVIYKFIVAIIFTTALGKFVYKYSEDPCLSFAIYGSLFYNMFSLTGYRQVLAVAIILYGYRFIRERKFIPFLILVLIGALFHKTTLMFILLYVLANKKITFNYILSVSLIFLVMLVFNRQVFEMVKRFFGYDEYVGNYGFKQATFTVLYSGLTIVAFWKFKDVVSGDEKALQLYNGLILSWIMFPFVLESPSALRLVYNYGFVILPLVPKIVSSFKESKDRQIIYLAIYVLFFVQTIISSFAYSFFWM